MSGKEDTSVAAPIPDFNLAQHIFVLKNESLSKHHKESLEILMTEIKKERLGPLYWSLHKEVLPTILPWDEILYDSIVVDNETEIATLKKDENKDNEDEGELELSQQLTKLGEYYAKIGDRANAVTTLKKALAIAPSTGAKIDISLTLARIAFFYDDKPTIKKQLDEIQVYIDRGGDWERRNRFKTYHGLYLLSIRKFNEAAELLIDSLATFTSTEITTYEQIAEFAVVAGAFSLGRVDLKNKIVDSPEILSLLSTAKSLEPIVTLTNALYTCDYATYFRALVEFNDQTLIYSRYLAPHSKYYVREMRIKGYAQLLESYKALSLKTMADAFGISVEFLTK